MKSKIFKLIIMTAVVISSFSSANATINYANSRLTISENNTNGHVGLYVANWNEMHWIKGTNEIFQIVIDSKAAILAGINDRILFYNTSTKTYNNIVVANVFNQSDARAKKNVTNVQSGLVSLLQLRPVSYNWADKPASKESAATDSIQMPGDPQVRLQYGFLAQEVEEILPDLVLTEENGSKSVNYIAMIPLLVQSVKELQSTVERQAEVIEQLQGTVAYKSKAVDAGNKIKSVSPNPTTGNFSVELQLSNASAEVFLTISDMGGNKQQIIEVNYAQGIVSVDASSLPQGVFILSLYINNMLADSCRLIKE